MDSRGGSMNEYELTVLIHPDLESNLDSALDKVRGLITDNGGGNNKKENRGEEKMGSTIKREDFAIYVCFEVKLPAPALLKISNTLNITDEVLRYLLVKTDEKTRQALSEQKARNEEADSSESNK